MSMPRAIQVDTRVVLFIYWGCIVAMLLVALLISLSAMAF